MDAVTGAFSYLGSFIARALLDRGRSVLTLSRRRDEGHPLSGDVAFAPLQFDDPAQLAASLRGIDTLYNTYWVRFPRGRLTWDDVLANTNVLLRAAERAGVRRIVQVSVSNCAPDSPFPYFRAKALAERALHERSAYTHAIVRPTLIFGRGDILVNNIAWVLRRLPVFVVAGDGAYPVQPVAAQEVARLCADAGARSGDGAVIDAGGPDVLTFEALVRHVRRATGGRARIVRAPPSVALALAGGAGLVLRDALLTRVELDAVMAGMLALRGPGGGGASLQSWLDDNAGVLGVRFVSERRMNWR